VKTMTKKRKKGKRKKKGSIDRCFGKWRVDISKIKRDFCRDYPSACDDLIRWKRELETDLNTDLRAIFNLLRNPVIYEVEGVKRRRARVSTKGGWMRLLFVVNLTRCEVIIVDYGKRRNHTYTRFRRRKK